MLLARILFASGVPTCPMNTNEIGNCCRRRHLAGNCVTVKFMKHICIMVYTIHCINDNSVCSIAVSYTPALIQWNT